MENIFYDYNFYYRLQRGAIFVCAKNSFHSFLNQRK